MDNKDSKILSDDKLVEMIEMIQRQTDYDAVVAREKLIEMNYEPIRVIKYYMGISEKTHVIKSVNQEIYRQMRSQLDITAFNHKQQDKLLAEMQENNE
jgi:hypothetical protein